MLNLLLVLSSTKLFKEFAQKFTWTFLPRFTVSDSDSVSRVSFLLDEDYHVRQKHRKTQSMTNFLDLNSDAARYMYKYMCCRFVKLAQKRVPVKTENHGEIVATVAVPYLEPAHNHFWSP